MFFAKSRKSIIIPTIIVIILAGLVIFKYLSSPSFPTLGPIVEQEPLTRENYIEDFEYAYDILETYYPFFQVNKTVNNIDWLGNREQYREMVLQCKTDDEFYETLSLILADINNNHTHLLDPRYGLDSYVLYKMILPRFDWRVDMIKIFEKDTVQARYNITNERIEHMVEHMENYVPPDNSPKNFIVGDIISKKVAYIGIKEMLTPDLKLPSFKEEHDIIKSYLEEVKDYSVLVIDIRENGGGNSRYWSEFLMPLIVDKTYSQSTYSFVKEGSFLDKFKRQSGFNELDKEKLEDFNFSEETNKMVEDFSYYNKDTIEIAPSSNSINFKGNLYLLVDKYVYSSSEKLASFAKETEMAVLVGERTGGDGIGSDPMLIDLPNTGYILRFSTELGVTEEGSINELDQTEPDILVSEPTKITRGSGMPMESYDESIISVLKLEGFN